MNRMKFIIGQNNVKLFAKSILTLSKIGDELYLEPLNESLTIRTTNSSRSTFACFTFKQSFFVFFEPNLLNKNRLNTTVNHDQSMNLNNTTIGPTTSRRAQNNDEDDSLIEEVEPFKCKIPAKCLLSIFKNINSLEKNVEKCTITVKYIPLTQESASKVYDYDSTMITKMYNKNNEPQLYDTKFLIIMSLKHGIRKTFILSISDCENLQTAFLPRNCTNHLNISSKYFHETMNSFSNDTDEVSFIVEPSKLVIKNYVLPENADLKSLINTQVSFDCEEFEHYEIDKELETITFCLKEFKICLLFGFWFDLPLDIYFKHRGRPIIFVYNSNNNLEANFTFATLSDDSMNSQNSTISSNPNTMMNHKSQFNRSSRMEREKSFNQQNITQLMDESLQGPNLLYQKSKSNNDTMNKNENSINNKGNKRTLYDASNNQVYLNDLVDNNNETEILQDDDVNDDILLSQALNAHEEKDKTRNVSNYNIPQTPSPPAKKMKSLVQSLFDENEENMNQTVTETKQKRHSLAMFLNMTRDEILEEESCTKKGSVYVDDTDNEDEESD